MIVKKKISAATLAAEIFFLFNMFAGACSCICVRGNTGFFFAEFAPAHMLSKTYVSDMGGGNDAK